MTCIKFGPASFRDLRLKMTKTNKELVVENTLFCEALEDGKEAFVT